MTVSERLAALARLLREHQWSADSRYWLPERADELDAIIAEVEAVAGELRMYECPVARGEGYSGYVCEEQVGKAAARLAPPKEIAE